MEEIWQRVDEWSEKILMFSIEGNNATFAVWVGLGVVLGLFHSFIFNRFLQWDKKEIYFTLFSMVAFTQSGYGMYLINSGEGGEEREREQLNALYWRTLTLLIAHTYIARPWLVRLEDAPPNALKPSPSSRKKKNNIFTAYRIVNEVVEKRLDVRSSKRLLASLLASFLMIFALYFFFLYLVDFHRSLLKLFVPLLLFKTFHFFVVFIAFIRRFLPLLLPSRKRAVAPTHHREGGDDDDEGMRAKKNK